MIEQKYLTLPTKLGDVTVELDWDSEKKAFVGVEGRLIRRFNPEELGEMARKAGLTLDETKARLDRELDLDHLLA